MKNRAWRGFSFLALNLLSILLAGNSLFCLKKSNILEANYGCSAEPTL